MDLSTFFFGQGVSVFFLAWVHEYVLFLFGINLSTLLRAQMWDFCLRQLPSFTDDEHIGILKSQKDSNVNESFGSYLKS